MPLSPVEATLRLAERAGWSVSTEEGGSGKLRRIGEARLVFGTYFGRNFAPWLSLDDGAELAEALRKAGVILACNLHMEGTNPATVYVPRSPEIALACAQRGVAPGRPVRADAPTPALALFRALCSAVLNEVPE